MTPVNPAIVRTYLRLNDSFLTGPHDITEVHLFSSLRTALPSFSPQTLKVVWVHLHGGPRGGVPQLRVFNDSWPALADFADVLKFMGQLSQSMQGQNAFCRMLEYFGITPVKAGPQ